MSWGTGSTGQIAEAHRALDAVGVRAGPLALRVLAAAGRIDGQREDLETLQLVADCWRDVAEAATHALVAPTSNHPSPPVADAPGAAQPPETDDSGVPRCSCGIGLLGIPAFRRPRCLRPECPQGDFAAEIDGAWPTPADPCTFPYCPEGSEPDPAHE